MKATPVIGSLLETDLYKLTMWQPMLHHYPSAQAEYRFVCRNQSAFPLGDLVGQVNEELDALCSLNFTQPELRWLSTLRFLKPDFIDYLHLFRFQRRFIEASNRDGTLEIVAHGPIIHVMGFEIHVLAIVNELYFRELERRTGVDPRAEGEARLDRRIARLRALESEIPQRRFPFELFEFGLRRRYSGAWHRHVVERLRGEVPQCFKGTSCLKLAMDLGITPIGTMAHEWLQLHQATGVRLLHFQKAALETWVQEYRGDLGIALTDVVGMDAFLRDFDLYFAKLFDGLRHDSGDPVEWGEKALRHYRALRVDAATKRLVFSDGLDIEPAIGLWRHFADRAMTGFGIGTRLTNDLGPKALNIVMKLTRCNGTPVAKLSDSPGKTLCDDEGFLRYLAQVFGQQVM